MDEMQFCATMLMSLLTLTLVFLLPRRAAKELVISRSRWLMAMGTALLGIQFFLQYKLGLRAMGVTQAVMLNLLLFVPCSWLLCVSVLYLQRQGRVSRVEWIAGGAAWMVVIVLLVGTALSDGQPLLSDSPQMRFAEIAGGVVYALMQGYYSWLHYKELVRIHRSLDSYFDREMGSLLQWMERSLLVLAMIAIAVPLLIFGSGWPLVAYGMVVFFGVYYMVISFVCYVVSSDSRKVLEAEDERAERREESSAKTGSEKTVSADMLQHVGKAVEQWKTSGGHLHSGITVQMAADEMSVPRYLLTAWLKTTPQELFNPWINSLRIEEAQHQMELHPDWSNDAIADYCGFSSRSYFQTVFRKQTGMTPAQYVSSKV
jgi:AraC-like DNA-binding protein/drug/metabolite transporter (DMT)-like permease